MEKKQPLCNLFSKNYKRKLLLAMKLTSILMLLATLQLSAGVYSQNARLNLQFRNGTLADVIEAIENQSDYKIFYKTDQVDIRKNVTVDELEGTVASVLNKALEGTTISYQVMDKLIVLTSNHYQTVQQIKITGTVTDATSNETLPGVNIIVDGSTIGAITDARGKYSIEIPNANSVLTFSFIGYNKERIEINGRTKVDVSLVPDIQKLDEVVVIGYGTSKKSDLSGASVSLSSDKIKGSIGANLDQALQGRVAGVTAVQTSGQPGSSVSIRVRGQSTINANAEPLYVIDGVPVQISGTSGSSFGLGDALGNGATSTISPLSTINPSDIVSMEILKDASSTAIYGSRASNGVILVTTKRGKSGEAKFSYEGMYGVQRQAKRLKVMDLQQFAEFSNSIASETSAREPRNEFLDPTILGAGTNWQNAVYQLAPMQSHTISASGGTDFVKYYVSGSYLGQEGTIIGSKFDRFSFRSNLDAQLKKWLKMGINLTSSTTNERLGLADSDEGIINIALLSTPDVPIYDINGKYTSVTREGAGSRVNPIAKALQEDNLLDRASLNGNIFFDISILKELTFHTEYAMNKGNSDAERWQPIATYGSWTRATNSSSKQHNDNFFWQVKNYLTYSKEFGIHKFSAMLGQEMQESTYKFQSVANSKLPDNTIHNPNLGTNTPTIGSGFGSSSLASGFARGTYNFNDKYYATYTFRRDGSSNFGPLNRWASFHAAAASWRVTNENFMESVKPVISNLKLRLGWGQTGNQNIGGYLWGSAISVMETGLGVGYRQSGIANPYIKWETQEQTNIGLDLGILKNRIELTLDVYDKVSNDMLMQMQLPSYMGTRGNQSSALAAPFGNYGTIDNKGLEISLATHNFTHEFQWDTDLQLTFNKNKLVALDGVNSSAIEGYGQWSDVVSRTEIGQPLYNFYGYKVVGIFKDKTDILNSPTQEKSPTDGKSYSRTNSVYPGDIKFADISGPNGVPDGKIDEYDRTNIGSPMPIFTFGLNNTLRYKNFDMNIFINGSYGNKVINYSSINLTSMTSLWNNQLATVTDRARLTQIDPSLVYPYVNSTGQAVDAWFNDIDNVKVANENTSIPRGIQNDPNNNHRLSDRYIEDGSYLRIKNIALGYNFPKKVLNILHLQSLRIYANIQNIYTFTNYTGFDPEIGASTASTNVYGLDNGRYPSPQVYTFGLNLSF